MAYIFTGYDGDGCLVVKSKEAAAFHVGDWTSLKFMFQCSLLPTGNFNEISGSYGSGITGSIQIANNFSDYIYFGLKSNNHCFVGSGYQITGIGASGIEGNFLGYTNRSQLGIGTHSINTQQGQLIGFSPFLLYQSSQHSGIESVASDIYIHNINQNQYINNAFNFVVVNENETSQYIDVSNSSATTSSVLDSGKLVDALNASFANNKSVNWNPNTDGALPNQIFVYNGHNDYYLRILGIAIEKQNKSYLSVPIDYSGVFVNFSNWSIQDTEESVRYGNQAVFSGASGWNYFYQHTNNTLNFSIHSLWTGAFFDFSNNITGTSYSGDFQTSDMLWYPNQFFSTTIIQS